MTVLIIADLHLDMWTEAGRDPFAGLSAAAWSGIEAVIVAGDLTNKPRIRWKYAIRHLSRYIDPGRVHILPGNHDYYDFKLDGEDRLAEIARSEGAHFLQKSEVVIGNTRLLCCTLWTDFALHGDVAASQAIAKSRMNDYRYIRNAGAGYRRIGHTRQRQFIRIIDHGSKPGCPSPISDRRWSSRTIARIRS